MAQIQYPKVILDTGRTQIIEKSRIPKWYKLCFGVIFGYLLFRDISPDSVFLPIQHYLLETHLVFGKGACFISENIFDLP